MVLWQHRARLTIAMVLLAGPILAQQALVLVDSVDQHSLSPYVEVLEDESGQWTIDDVTSPELSRRFVGRGEQSVNLGFTESAYWLRFRLATSAARQTEWLLEIDRPLIDHIELHLPDGAEGPTIRRAGRVYPFGQREVEHRHFVFRLAMEPGASGVYHLRLESKSSIHLSPTLWSPAAFARMDHQQQMALGLFYGILAVMVVYNLLLFVSLRDQSFLYYGVYIICFGLAMMVRDGLAYEYLFPNLPTWNREFHPIIMGVAIFWAVQFFRSFLMMRTHVPKMDKAMAALMVVAALAVAWELLGDAPAALPHGLMLVAVVLALASAILCARLGYRPAYYCLAVWIAFFIFLCSHLLMNFGWLPYNLLTKYGPYIGSVLNAVLFSLGLADRINLIQEAEAAHRQRLGELERELEICREMQMALMPTEHPQLEGFDIAGRCIPATQVGGDIFDYVHRGDGKFCMAVADVSGHAMEAAIPVVVFSGILKTQVEAAEPIEDLFVRLNHSAQHAISGRSFICFVMGELDISSRLLRLCNGACPSPYHYQSSSGELRELELQAYPLGVRSDTEYEVLETQLEAGDRVVFCSDGIVEAANAADEIFGFDRTADAIRRACAEGLPAVDLIDQIIAAAHTFSGDSPQRDDMTCVVLAVEEAVAG